MAISAEEVSTKVQRIVHDGDDTDILEGPHERQRALRLLHDYAEHPHTSDTVVERATDAIEQLRNPETDDE